MELLFGLMGCLALCPGCIQTVVSSDIPDECTTYWQEFKRKHSSLKVSFMRWKPAGNKLIRQLRESADQLDTYQKATDSTELLGGVVTFAGAVMAAFPPTMPLGTALSLGGLAAGLGASGVNYVKSSNIQEYVNKMITDQKFGYLKLQEATDEYQKLIPDMVACLDDDDYLKFTEETDGYEEVPFREFSEAQQEEKHKGSLGKSGHEGGVMDSVYKSGKVATIVANGERLAKVAPYIKYAGISNRAMKAKMIKEAINAANVAKASGVTGAAGRAVRFAEINKASSAIKAAKEGVKMGRWGIAVAAAGYAFAIVDIAVNINDLASGSVTAESKNYRSIADDLETVMRDIDKLLAIGVNVK